MTCHKGLSECQARPRADRGMTLIELLVALTVMTFLLSVAFHAIGLAFRIVDDADLPTAEVVQRFSRLRDSLGSTLHYIRQTRGRGGHPAFSYALRVRPSSILFVTARPALLPGPALGRIRLAEKTLVLEEHPLYAASIDYRDPAFPEEPKARTRIFDDVKTLRVHPVYRPANSATPRNTRPASSHPPDGISMDIEFTDKPRQTFFIRLRADADNRLDTIRAGDLLQHGNPIP